ncbi:hypothetical protein KSP39_PZI020326 [Platanthera zijinensis]|uniref:Uncharacterized protein n=1 Tax=Platanthera zijinensis TaxID=2320716 RepID=A0AAP0AZ32_9ASPA
MCARRSCAAHGPHIFKLPPTASSLLESPSTSTVVAHSAAPVPAPVSSAPLLLPRPLPLPHLNRIFPPLIDFHFHYRCPFRCSGPWPWLFRTTAASMPVAAAASAFTCGDLLLPA